MSRFLQTVSGFQDWTITSSSLATREMSLTAAETASWRVSFKAWRFLSEQRGNMDKQQESIASVIAKNETLILKEWIRQQLGALTMRRDLISDKDLEQESSSFLKLFVQSFAKGNVEKIESSDWSRVRDYLDDLSRSRARQGFSPSETATFVFSLKQPVFDLLREEYAKDSVKLADALWQLTMVLDKLGLYTTEVYQKSREEVIRRQQEEMLELSTPVVRLWDDILALPMIGTLDSARTQVVMESLLQAIVDTGATIAIIDITGVPTVDTLVAQHLLKTVAAARLMGADCIISGIRPQIAQTIVHLGVDLQDVITKATLADAFAVALKKLNLSIMLA
jgi:rsbT co-antagonist protein RsbR